MIDPNCYFIKEDFFANHPGFQKMLDSGDTGKQSKRTHICIRISDDTNTYYIPLRNNLGAEVRKFGRIGHAVPAQNRPNAGLDFRHALVINDSSLVEAHKTPKLPNSQYSVITNEYDTIKQEFMAYLNGYKKAAGKNRVSREALYRESSLINFHQELGL